MGYIESHFILTCTPVPRRAPVDQMYKPKFQSWYLSLLKIQYTCIREVLQIVIVQKFSRVMYYNLLYFHVK